MKNAMTMVFEGGANILAVDRKGSPMSTNVNGGHTAALAKIAEWYRRGEAEKDKPNPWNEQIIHAYVYSHKKEETFSIDLTNPQELVVVCLH